MFSLIPTVQEKAYSRWFNEIEPKLWGNEENRVSLSLPSIVITSPTSRYLCSSNEYGCTVSVNQEQLLRYLRLIEVSRAMRLTKPAKQTEKPQHTIEIRIYSEAQEQTSLCKSISNSDSGSRPGLPPSLFSGIVAEKDSGITLRNLLSLIEHSCARVSD